MAEKGGLQPALPEPPESSDVEIDDCRLWVGNLDTRVTEYAVLKLLQKYGHLKTFDFLYHKQGPDQGKPRGYCFVTYNTKEEAQNALQGLHGKVALSKKIIVKYAHADKKFDLPEKKAIGPGFSSTAQEENSGNISTQTKIQAIEAKLKLMEQSKDEFSLSDKPCHATKPSIIAKPTSTSQETKNYGKKHHGRPYERRKGYR